MSAGERHPAAGRVRFGSRDSRGRYPVAVDVRPAGHVYRTRRAWWALGLGDNVASEHRTRAAALAGLVRLVDSRDDAAEALARKMRRRTEAPEGWTLSTWHEVRPGAVVRTPGICRRVEAGSTDGLLYPELWGDPVQLTRIEHLPNGCVLAYGLDGETPAWLGMGVLLSTPAYAELGVLVPGTEAASRIGT